MLRLFIVALVVGVAWLLGGSFRNFASLQLRLIPVVVGSFVLQLLIFTPFLDQSLISVATPQIYVFSMLLLIIWVAANWRIPGMALMALGLLMNLVAIVANNGYMPVSPESAIIAGNIAMYPTEGPPVTNNSIATTEQVRLWLLTDIIPVPKEVPFANVFSIGDILLTLGVCVLCYRTLHKASPVVLPMEASSVG